MIPTYADFILANPAFGVAPYTQVIVQSKLDEVAGMFPMIMDCLPESLHPLATLYGVNYLFQSEECESPFPIVQVKSRNDEITYSLGGKGNVLINSNWGMKLNRLFKANGCFTKMGGTLGGCQLDHHGCDCHGVGYQYR